MTEARFGRRAVIRGGAGLVGAAAAGGLAACSSNTAGANTIDFWHLLSGGDGNAMVELSQKVNDLHLGFTTQQTVLAWGAPYYTKLAMATVAGKAPDLAIMHLSRLAGYAPGGLLDPWDMDLLAEYGVDKDTFPAPVWERAQYQGKTYAIALDTHPFIMFYNKKIIEKAGLMNSFGRMHAAASPEEFYAQGRKIAEVTGRHGFSYGYLGDGAQINRLFTTLYAQLGSEIQLKPGSKAVIDTDAALTVLNYMRHLLDEKVATRNNDGGTAESEFLEGGSGVFLSGVWETSVLKDSDLDFDAMAIPKLWNKPAAFGDSHSFVLPHQDQPGTARREAHRFVAEILKHSRSWAEAGHIPAYQPIVNAHSYKKLVPQSHYAGVADIVDYGPSAWFAGAGSNYETYMNENLQQVLVRQTDAATGLQNLIKRLNRQLSHPNPV